MTGVVNSTGARSGIIGTTSAPAVGTGTDGYVLTATGAGVDPAWEAAAAGGKILQIVHTDNFHSQTFDTDLDIVIEASLTGVLASSYVACWTTCTIYIENGSSAEGFETHVYRKDGSTMGVVGAAQSGGTKINVGGGGSSQDSATFIYKGADSSSLSLYFACPYFCIDESPGTGDVFYALIGSSYTGTPTNAHDGGCSILLMEIAV